MQTALNIAIICLPRESHPFYVISLLTVNIAVWHTWRVSRLESGGA